MIYLSKFTLVILTAAALAWPTVAFAADPGGDVQGGNGYEFTCDQGTAQEQEDCRNRLAQEHVAPQTKLDNLQDVPPVIIDLLFGFLPGIATLYLILSGYRYVVAQGNQDLTEKAKKSLLYAVVGVIISYTAVAIILTVSKALGYHI